MPCRIPTAVSFGAIPLGPEVGSNPNRSRAAVIAAELGVFAIGVGGDGSGEEGLGTLSVLVKFRLSVKPLSTMAVTATPMATLAPEASLALARIYTKGWLEEPAVEVTVRMSLSPLPLAIGLRLSVFHGSFLGSMPWRPGRPFKMLIPWAPEGAAASTWSNLASPRSGSITVRGSFR